MLLSRLERLHLNRLTIAGYNLAWKTTKASASAVEASQDDYIKEICSPGSYGPNSGRLQLDTDPLLILILGPFKGQTYQQTSNKLISFSIPTSCLQFK